MPFITLEKMAIFDQERIYRGWKMASPTDNGESKQIVYLCNIMAQ